VLEFSASTWDGLTFSALTVSGLRAFLFLLAVTEREGIPSSLLLPLNELFVRLQTLPPDRVPQPPAQAEASGQDGLAADVPLCVN